MAAIRFGALIGLAICHLIMDSLLNALGTLQILWECAPNCVSQLYVPRMEWELSNDV